MKFFLAICVSLFACTAYAKTYQYTGGSITDQHYYIGSNDPVGYHPIGPINSPVTAIFDADLAPGTTTEVGSVRISAGALNAVGYGDVTTDENGQIVDWYISAYVGGSDFTYFELKTVSEKIGYRYEFECEGAIYCQGSELIKVNSEGGSWAVVPVPASALMLLTALGALGVARRRAA